jgi:hypothetical protein
MSSSLNPERNRFRADDAEPQPQQTPALDGRGLAAGQNDELIGSRLGLSPWLACRGIGEEARVSLLECVAEVDGEKLQLARCGNAQVSEIGERPCNSGRKGKFGFKVETLLNAGRAKDGQAKGAGRTAGPDFAWGLASIRRKPENARHSTCARRQRRTHVARREPTSGGQSKRDGSNDRKKDGPDERVPR